MYEPGEISIKREVCLPLPAIKKEDRSQINAFPGKYDAL